MGSLDINQCTFKQQLYDEDFAELSEEDAKRYAGLWTECCWELGSISYQSGAHIRISRNVDGGWEYIGPSHLTGTPLVFSKPGATEK